MYAYIFEEIHICVCMSNYILFVEIKMKYKCTSLDSFPYSIEKNQEYFNLYFI